VSVQQRSIDYQDTRAHNVRRGCTDIPPVKRTADEEKVSRAEGSGVIADVVSEIDHLIGSRLTDNELWDLWVKDWHASYDPGDAGQSMRSWLASVRSRLADGTP
jgi:hypothetical protein